MLSHLRSILTTLQVSTANSWLWDYVKYKTIYSKTDTNDRPTSTVDEIFALYYSV